MEVTAVVLHEGALAHYEVNVGKDGICTAQLSRYNGNPAHAPARQIILHKEGRHWVADTYNSSLSDDLGYAIELKAKPILLSRNRNGGHPAA
ncbi:MAG TPA: hypothetical protein VGC75_06835 [Candidatus Nitrosocosmicus sp.]|jgi:hypothetical protein